MERSESESDELLPLRRKRNLVIDEDTSSSKEDFDEEIKNSRHPKVIKHVICSILCSITIILKKI